MARDKIHKHVRVREILEDGKWHSMSELALLVGTTPSNIHIIVGKISLKELDFKFKWDKNICRKYVRLVSEEAVLKLARENPGVWGQLFWSVE
jgi:hypothetical protein